MPYWTIAVDACMRGPVLRRKLDAAAKAATDVRVVACKQPVAQQAADRIRAAPPRCCRWTPSAREAPPLPFDLGTLQEVCSQAVGPGRAGDAGHRPGAVRDAQGDDVSALGTRAICPRACWPRCRPCSTAWSKTDPSLRPLIDRLTANQRSRVWNDGKVTAHHGIIPTLEPANPSAMNEKELAVYRLIRAHYLAQFLPHHEFDRTVAQFSCGGQSLAAVGKQIAVIGWRGAGDAGPDDADGEDAQRSQVLPALHAGLSCPVGKVDLKALKTLPPKPHTQGRADQGHEDRRQVRDRPA